MTSTDSLPTLSIADLDADPHAVFRHYRSRTALIKREDKTYLALRMDDAESLIMDPRTRQLETDSVKARGLTSGPLFDFVENSMLTSNGQTHRKRRAPVSRALGFRVIEALRPRIREIASGLIDRVFTRGQMNFLGDFASPLPAQLIGEIIGIGAEDVPRFTRWVYNFTRALSVSYTQVDVPQIQADGAALRDYVSAQLEQRRKYPREDFLTSFLQAVEEQATLSPLEAITQVMTVIIGGSDTTRAALTIMVRELLQHREQWDAVCRDPGLISGAVAESLRYDAIVGTIPRVVLQPIDVDGYTLPAGSIVSASILSALRDPDIYMNPEIFDIWRNDHPPRHLAFGAGVHRCLGESLARAELEESLAVLTKRLPSVQLRGEPPKLLGHSGLRRVTNMQLAW